MVMPPSEGAMGTFVVLTEAGALRWPVFPDRVLRVGRGPDCDVRIDHPSVSRHHAYLEPGAAIILRDDGSSNGTVVGTRRLAGGEGAVLRPGVVIEIGAVFAVWQPSANALSMEDTVEDGFEPVRGVAERESGIRRIHDSAAPAYHVSPTLPPGGYDVAFGDAGPEGASDSGKLPLEMRALERRRIEEALNACNGNQTRAAERLGISRRTLIARMDEWKLPRPRKRAG
jgi:predicted component of type VI protein secretion system